MAKVIVDKSGKIIVVDDKNVKHTTSFKVTSTSPEATIKKQVTTAIKMNKAYPGVSGLYGKADSIAKNIYNKMQKKGEVKEKPETKTKKEPKTKEKKAKTKTKKGKTGAKKKKPAETLPKKKTVTISVSAATVTKVISLANKKKDKKLQNELQKLASSYTNVKEYVESNSEAVTAEIFNTLYADEYFEYHVDAMAAEDPAFEELILHVADKKLTKNSGADFLELANTALRSYLLSEMEVNNKLSKEINALGGIESIGPMNGKLFFTSMLYLRRLNNPKAQVLKLNLVETVEKPKEKEKPKVKYKL